jgi:hypothetical protein
MVVEDQSQGIRPRGTEVVGCAVVIAEEGESTLQRTAAKSAVLQNKQKNVEDAARVGARGT